MGRKRGLGSKNQSNSRKGLVNWLQISGGSSLPYVICTGSKVLGNSLPAGWAWVLYLYSWALSRWQECMGDPSPSAVWNHHRELPFHQEYLQRGGGHSSPPKSRYIKKQEWTRSYKWPQDLLDYLLFVHLFRILEKKHLSFELIQYW